MKDNKTGLLWSDQSLHWLGAKVEEEEEEEGGERRRAPAREGR